MIHGITFTSLTGAVHRFTEEIREGHAGDHDVLLLESDQRLFSGISPPIVSQGSP